jgi:hypothetical protein
MQATDRIGSDLRDLLADDTIVSRLTATGQVVNFGTAAEFTSAIDLQRSQAAEAARNLGTKPSQ